MQIKIYVIAQLAYFMLFDFELNIAETIKRNHSNARNLLFFQRTCMVAKHLMGFIGRAWLHKKLLLSFNDLLNAQFNVMINIAFSKHSLRFFILNIN